MNSDRRSNRKRKYLIAGAVVMLALLLVIALVLRGSGSKVPEGTVSGESQSGTELQEESDGGESGSSGSEESSDPELLATVFCASDYQAEEGWDTPAENLTGILDSALSGLHVIDCVIMCGDYTNDRRLHDYQLSAEESIAEIKETVQSYIPGLTDDNMIFVQGNHDAMTGSITASGLHDHGRYLVYVLNTENDFPWKQGKVAGSLNKVRASSARLEGCLSELAEKGETRPVIIAGHVPLHFTARTSSRHTTGDNLYSSLIFNVVNDAAEDLDIVYLFGHNHSKGWDCYLGGGSIFMPPGEKILIPQFEETQINTDHYTEETLNFTYMNAGYTGYYMNCGTEELDNGTWRDYDAADGTLTGTTIGIYDDRLVFTRWDSNGMHDLNGTGAGDPYRGGIDADLIPSDEYRTSQESPQTVMRKQ